MADYPPPPNQTWHIGARDRRYAWRDVTPGTFLPPRASWSTGFGQYVVDRQTPQSGNARGSLTVLDYDVPEDHPERIRTIAFAPEQGLYCPELRSASTHPDLLKPEHLAEYQAVPSGSVDWRKVGRAPQAGEVQVGDVLPAKNPDPLPGQPHPDGLQKVVRVRMNYDGRLIVTLRDRKATRRYTVLENEQLLFPRIHTTASTSLTGPERRMVMAQALRDAEVFAWRRNPATGQVFKFIRHPYGRGRWPANVADFHPQFTHKQGHVIVCRPPEDDDMVQAMLTLEPCDPVENAAVYTAPHDIDWSLTGLRPPAA